MKTRPLLLFGASGILGLIAIGLIKGIILPSGSRTTKVVVATVTLQFGDAIQASNLELVDYSPESVPQGAFHSIDELTKGEPRYVIETIHASEAVLSAKITGKGGKASLSSVIDQDKRAVTIRVDDVFGVAGFVTPADHVDVMLTRGDPLQRAVDNPRTEVLLQNVKVLAIDQESNEHKDKPTVAKAVTLEVTPEDAEKLALARTVGTLSLTLRNFTDPKAVNSRPISLADLSGAAPPATRHPGRSGATLAIIRGTHATSYELDGDSIRKAAAGPTD